MFVDNLHFIIMQTVLFLIDNSASMNQKCYLGTTLLDVAKGAVETFIKQRANRTDKYLLLTLDEAPFGVKAGWKECQNHGVILNRLKSVSADGLTTIGQALKLSFDILSVNRHLSGIDTYGQGRSPFYLEPSMIVAIIDGEKLSNRSTIFNELHLPMANALPGSELTKEPFRWDQRLFSLVLRLPASATQEPDQLGSVPIDSSPISLMCEVTGGRSYCIRTHKTLLQCLDSLLQKVQSGVVIHFERDAVNDREASLRKAAFPSSILSDSFGKQSPVRNSDPIELKCETPAWHSLHRMIYVRPNAKSGLPIGHWPLPESYCPDHNAPTLPPRSAHPTIRFRTEDAEPILLPNFPYDKYELEPSPLTQILLEKKNSSSCWIVYVENSGKQTGISHPCGYLKASTNLTCVNLFVMPYNYPVLLPLIEQLIKQKMKPSTEWRRMFDDYLKTLPPYYINPLRKSFKQIAAPNLIADSYNTGLSYSVTVYFKKLKEQTKMTSDRFLAPSELGHSSRGVAVHPRFTSSSVTQLPNFQKLLAAITGEDSHSSKIEASDFPSFRIGRPDAKKQLLPRAFHNPFDIPRKKILWQLRKMRMNFKQIVQSSFAKAVGSSIERAFRIRLQDRIEIHNQPISQMGNYQDYVKALPTPLREANPDAPRRLHTFGNPFKLAKEKGIMIDETEDYDGPSAGSGSQGKRKLSSDHGAYPNKRKRAAPRSLSKPMVRKASQPTKRANEPLLQNDKTVTQEEIASSEKAESSPGLASRDPEQNKDNDVSLSSTSPAPSDSTLKKSPVHIPASPRPGAGARCTNMSLFSQIATLIRSPGKHCAKVRSLLGELEGSVGPKRRLVEKLSFEAQRFKRHSLILILREFSEHFKKADSSDATG